jgi:hypothetical protein
MYIVIVVVVLANNNFLPVWHGKKRVCHHQNLGKCNKYNIIFLQVQVIEKCQDPKFNLNVETLIDPTTLPGFHSVTTDEPIQRSLTILTIATVNRFNKDRFFTIATDEPIQRSQVFLQL